MSTDKFKKKTTVNNKTTGETQQMTSGMNPSPNKSHSKKHASEAHSSKNNEMEKEDKVPITANEKKQRKTKRKEPESVEEFLEQFFSTNRKALPENIAKSFNQSISNFTFENMEILKNCLDKDRSLEKTKQLLLLLIDHKQLPKLEKLLKDVVKKLIISSEVNDSIVKEYFPLAGQQSCANLDDLWKSFGLNLSVSGSKGDKPDPTLIKARKNVFFCAALWKLNDGDLSFKAFIEVLNHSIFSTLDKKEKTNNIIIEYMSVNLDGKSCKSIASLLDWFYQQTDNLLQKNNQLIQDKDQFEKLFNEHRNLVQIKDDEINVLKSQIESFQLEIKQVKEDQRVEKIHLQDDQRKQKGRTLRALEEETPMLQDALKALGREPAKIAVAKDYLGRALDNLNNELEQLRKN